MFLFSLAETCLQLIHCCCCTVEYSGTVQYSIVQSSTKVKSSWFACYEESLQKWKYTIHQDLSPLHISPKTHLLQCFSAKIFTVLYMYCTEMLNYLSSFEQYFEVNFGASCPPPDLIQSIIFSKWPRVNGPPI